MSPRTVVISFRDEHRIFIIEQLFYMIPELLLQRLKTVTTDLTGLIEFPMSEYELDELIGTLSSHANNTDNQDVREQADRIVDLLERYEAQLKV